jgi:hypothetical protein
MACADNAAVSAVAFEPALAFDHGLRAVPREPEARWVGATTQRLGPATHTDIEPWELHSELAREPVLPATHAVDEARHTTNLPLIVAGYTAWRLLETARTALLVFWGAVALALLAEALH